MKWLQVWSLAAFFFLSTCQSSQEANNPSGGSAASEELDPSTLMTSPEPREKSRIFDAIDPCENAQNLESPECIRHWSDRNQYVPANEPE